MNKIIQLTLIFLCNFITAQTFKGLLIDQLNEPISGANILNKSNDHHTHSNLNGEFIFENINIGDVLLISHISFENLEYKITKLDNQLEKITLISNTFGLEEVIISSNNNITEQISKLDLELAPVNTSQDILRKVPGLFIGQHAGGGKAEQIFLRGFDIDHGTDISISVDGLPVNMVSHAHGQGYADLHFVIPETIEKVDFNKGLYYEDKGNFNTAGYVDFQTKEKIENSFVKTEIGQFDTFRLVNLTNLVNTNSSNAYIASELMRSNGPFESSQDFIRRNIFGKYTYNNNNHKMSITASHFSSKWDASGQIPVRAVESGLISRFGAIDDTEGGNTSRNNLLVNHQKKISDNSSIKTNAYINSYDFELFSNFTFFLEDPDNGDQIKQVEKRTIYGLNTEYKENYSFDTFNGSFVAGIGLRNDYVTENELSHTANRNETLNFIQLGDVNELNASAYLGNTINYKKWSLNTGIRYDYFDFQYNDHLIEAYDTQAVSDGILSPKLSLNYNYSKNFQLYAKTGKGFHSNDTRVNVFAEQENTLPDALGFDFGFIIKPTNKMYLNIAYWNLYLEQEFVYVGDAGIVEPSGETSRQGVELSYRYQPINWLYWNLDANYTHAKSINDPEGENYIPLAPNFSLVSGLNIKHESGIYGSIQTRLITDRPANEDNSIVAEGYCVSDLSLGYQWKKFNVGIQIQNLFDTEWNETQFATESRLAFETEAIEEIHFTPGTPFFLKTSFQYNF